MNPRRPLRITIVGDPRGWHVRRIAETAVARGHQARLVRWTELGTIVATGDEAILPAAVAESHGIVVRGMPGGGLEEVIFRMNLLGRLARIGIGVVNPPRSLEVAIDKHLSLAEIASAGLPVPRSMVAQSPEAIRDAWLSLGRDTVVKPLFGSQGRGIERISSEEDLAAFLAGRSLESLAYLQEFIPHAGWDARILLVGDRVFSMRRVADSGWRTNVAQGGRAEPFAPPEAWVALARRAARAVGAVVAGVDLVARPSGEVVILEVNAVPGWRALQTVVPTDITSAFTQLLESRFRG